MAIKGDDAKKTKGRVYTPLYIVKNILELSHYSGAHILEKHIIDNSCGDGAFLCEVVERYCSEAKRSGMGEKELRAQLEAYIHGIEIDPLECEKCKKRLSRVATEHGIKEPVDWDVICEDALSVDKYDGKMDFVVGNPPYVRVHNLNDSFDKAKKHLFAQNGMTDLYIVFYEIGIKMLNDTGILGYITPSSFFNSLAGSYMRRYLVEEGLIEALVDMKHFQAFESTTYTAIMILNKNHTREEIEYFSFDERELKPCAVELLSQGDYYIAGNFYFSTKKSLDTLKAILYNFGHCGIEVKNGYATLCDDVFVGSFKIRSRYIIPVIKASRAEQKRVIFPYNKKGKLISEKQLARNKALYRYLIENKEKLLERSLEKGALWYSFGRSQAINDTFKDKLAINSLIRSADDLKIVFAPAGTGVYGGLYLIGERQELCRAGELLRSEEFSNYISLLGKYKSGGYYTFSSKDVKAYLDYKLTGEIYEQCGI